MAPGKDRESNHLRSELLRILPLDLQRLFTNDARYDTDGFLMLKHLLEHLQPDSHQHKFLNMLEFANLARSVARLQQNPRSLSGEEWKNKAGEKGGNDGSAPEKISRYLLREGISMIYIWCGDSQIVSELTICEFVKFVNL
jgi:hypothetical protein